MGGNSNLRNSKNKTHRNGINKSFWECTIKVDSLDIQDEIFDVIIIGAGITGVTLANELQQKGKRCLLLEKEYPGFGTTGRTTAHINNFFDSFYDEVISNFGEEKAIALANASHETLRYIKRNVRRYRIQCEFSECSSYVFSSDNSQNKKLSKILKAHKIVGVKTNRTYDFPFDIPYKKAIEIHNQAQFHPLKYLKKILWEFKKVGGKILNQTIVTECKESIDIVIVETVSGKTFKAKTAVWSTHNAPGNTRFNLMIAPYRSYALSARLLEQPPKLAQCADLEDPYHYLRYHTSKGNHYLIAGGFDHKTGQETHPEDCFEALEEYVNERFKVEYIDSKWSAQYYVPVDGLPYIGKMPNEENIFLCTGFNGNGMTFGTMASLIIPQLIEGEETELSRLLCPSRITPLASAKNIITENANAFFRLISDRFNPDKNINLKTIKKEEGKLTDCDGQICAVYRDKKGSYHYMDPICPHMGCTVQWNTAEKSWDCPCHGSRFDALGELLIGPGLKNLSKINTDESNCNG